LPAEKFIKSMLYMIDNEPVLVLVRGDKEVNESKIQTFFQADSIELANDEIILKITGASTGFAGPINLKKQIKIIADFSVTNTHNMVCGANETDFHFLNVNFGRDFSTDIISDFIMTKAGEKCPVCNEGILESFRGIEVGQVFYLGTKYSEKMNCNYLDKNGKSQHAVMGCFGIGVGRTMQASIEQNHDENGIIWPVAIAPYEVIILPLQMNKENVVNKSEEIYNTLLEQQIDVILDDRNERAGFKFKDADLVGYPIQIIIGAKSLEKGIVEIKIRKTGEKFEKPANNIIDFIKEFVIKEKNI
jgi:prolyl-tRNA synthetase